MSKQTNKEKRITMSAFGKMVKIAMPSSKNTVLPILESILVEAKAKENSVTFTTTDLEITTSVTARNVLVSEDCSFVLDVKFISALLSEDKVVIKLVNNELHLEGGGFNIKLKSLQEVEDFPIIQSLKQVTRLNLSFQHIYRASTLCGKDELRPAMTGVLIEGGDSGIEVASTDAHRLCAFKFKSLPPNKPYSIIIPAKTINVVNKNMKDCDVDLCCNALDENDKVNYLRFVGAEDILSIVTTARSVDSRFPAYQAVIPDISGVNNRIFFNKSDLKATILKLLPIANKVTGMISFSTKGGSLEQIRLRAWDIDFGVDAEKFMGCEITGKESFSFCVNGKFLNTLLDIVEDEGLTIEFSAPNRALVIREANVTPESAESSIYLIMPIMDNDTPFEEETEEEVNAESEAESDFNELADEISSEA